MSNRNAFLLRYPVPHVIRGRIRFNTPGAADGVQIGVLPANVFILRAHAQIVTAFNAATTNVLNMGRTGAMAAYIDSDDVDESAAGVVANIVTGAGLVTAETPVFLRYTQTGAAATAGEAVALLEYVPLFGV